mmetsp:Transcript_18051/g.60435  ORF Transcript_18051/g.60435 Transcript_18051/m.60435 type:complete len:239 (+) Transcript_18051:16-732(+)
MSVPTSAAFSTPEGLGYAFQGLMPMQSLVMQPMQYQQAMMPMAMGNMAMGHGMLMAPQMNGFQMMPQMVQPMMSMMAPQMPPGPQTQTETALPRPTPATPDVLPRGPEHGIPCDICGKRFANRAQVTKHARRTHKIWSNRYDCPRCRKKSYSLMEDLNQHIKMCSKFHECGACGLRARRRITMQRHCAKTGHPLDGCFIVDFATADGKANGDEPEAEDDITNDGEEDRRDTEADIRAE